MNYQARPKTDRFGLIVQQNDDGGDCAANTGTLYAAFAAQELLGIKNDHEMNKTTTFMLMLNQLEKYTGVWTRHRAEPFNDPKTFSRDQTTPLIVAMGLFRSSLFHQRIKTMLQKQVKRFLKYQNNDFPAPNHLGYFFRALDIKWLWPYHLIADLFFIPSVLESCGIVPRWKHETKRFVWPDGNDVDDRNLILGLMLSYFRQPTPISWLCRVTYSKFRKQNFGNALLNEKSKVMGSLSWYFREQSGGNPFIAEQLRPIIERIFK